MLSSRLQQNVFSQKQTLDWLLITIVPGGVIRIKSYITGYVIFYCNVDIYRKIVVK